MAPRSRAIAFRAAETPLGQALLHGAKGRALWLAGRAKIDDWGSRPQAELHLEDAAGRIEGTSAGGGLDPA